MRNAIGLAAGHCPPTGAIESWRPPPYARPRSLDIPVLAQIGCAVNHRDRAPATLAQIAGAAA